MPTGITSPISISASACLLSRCCPLRKPQDRHGGRDQSYVPDRDPKHLCRRRRFPTDSAACEEKARNPGTSDCPRTSSAAADASSQAVPNYPMSF